MLEALGLWDDLLAEGHAPAYALRSLWGGEVFERSSLFDRYGQGFTSIA